MLARFNRSKHVPVLINEARQFGQLEITEIPRCVEMDGALGYSSTPQLVTFGLRRSVRAQLQPKEQLPIPVVRY